MNSMMDRNGAELTILNIKGIGIVVGCISIVMLVIGDVQRDGIIAYFTRKVDSDQTYRAMADTRWWTDIRRGYSA